MSGNLVRRLCAFAFGLALMSGLPATANAGEPYHLGVALGFTGAGAPYSRDAWEGIQVAADEINAAGGLLGEHPIDLFKANTKTKPEIAKRVVRDLIERDRVRAVVGTYSSAAALAVKPLLRDAEVIHIASVSNSEDITKLDPSPYTFSVVPNTYMMAKVTAIGTAKLAREKGWKTYSTIASNYAWGQSSQQIQVAELKKLAPEVKLLNEYWPSLGSQGFSAFAVLVEKSKPDFILESIAGADNARWFQAKREYRLYESVASPGALVSVTELTKSAKGLRRGISARTRAPFFAHMDNPRMQEFVAKYRTKHGRYPSDWAVMAYDGVHALRQGIEKAGSIDSPVVKDAMKGMTVETTRGRLFFRDIDNQLSVAAYFGTVKDVAEFDIPVLTDLVVLEAAEAWRPEAEILAARRGAGG